jgi:predicted TIM-barrel fold metal-dependent hydrolase
MGYAMMPKYYAEKIMSLHTSDRMLFGTDTPWHTPDMEKKLLGTLGLSSEDMDKITHKNAKRLLGIE